MKTGGCQVNILDLWKVATQLLSVSSHCPQNEFGG